MCDTESEVMDVGDGVKTPTPSQERDLLDEPNAGQTTESTSKKCESGKPVANLSDIKKILHANSKISSNELTVSLQTGKVVVMNQNTNRHRKTAKRNDAIRAGRSNVNPHERALGAIASGTPNKRNRVSGDTPPSVTQQAKKFMGNQTEPPATETGLQEKGNHTGDPFNAANPGDRSNGPVRGLSRNERRKNKRAKERAQNADNPMAPGGGQSSEGKSSNVKPSTSGTSEIQQVIPPGTISQGQADGAIESNVAAVTYAATVSGHAMAVIDQRQAGQMQLLTQERVDKINSLLTDAMIMQADSGNEPPAFENARLHSGAMRVACANDHTRRWLEQNVPALDPNKLWAGAKLVVLEFKDIPKPHKFNVVFRNINKNPKELFKLLEIQNKGISTKSWTVLSNVKRDNGTTMTIGVGQDSFDMLRDRSNTLYCGMGKAIFTAVKGCKENQTLLQQGTTATTAGTNIATEPKKDGLPSQNDPNKNGSEAMEVAQEGEGAVRVEGQAT